jgi:GMP synthase (glutamine-hydrolysing)
MPQVDVIRHVAFEDLGSFDAVLRQRGFAVRIVEAADGLPDLDAPAADLLVVLGGPIGVYETASYPFLNREIALVRERLAAGQPVLGLCLGCQIMAAALGSPVYPGPAKEIGWGPLQLSVAGMASPLVHLAGIDVLHWHGDTFDLPAGAIHLAATPATRNQAFAFAGNALALQFHPEVTEAGLQHWLVGHACELAAAGLSVAALREETARKAPALAAAGPALLRDWLAAIGL